MHVVRDVVALRVAAKLGPQLVGCIVEPDLVRACDVLNGRGDDIVEDIVATDQVLQMRMADVDQSARVTHARQDGCGQLGQRLPEVADGSAVFLPRLVERKARYDEDVDRTSRHIFSENPRIFDFGEIEFCQQSKEI